MHHLNTDVKVSVTEQPISFRKGDWYIPMNQAANRFLIETLEPQRILILPGIILMRYWDRKKAILPMLLKILLQTI